MAREVGEWLEQLGLSEYLEAFAKNRIKFDHLPDLSEDDLRELGVTAMGDRKLLSRAITVLANDGVESAEVTKGETDALPQRAAEAERRQLTVMFCDLVGSTALSQKLDPEDLREVMRRYQDTVAGLVARYEGHVAKFLGDGVLAFFGWPRAYEDQAERAVRAGISAAEAVANLKGEDNQALAARVGIATGQVVIGDIVGEAATEQDAVVGETPNLAARLLEVASPGQVVINSITRQLIGDALNLEEIGTHQLKGFKNPVAAWRVVGEPASETRSETARSRSLTHFVGREHEIGLLKNAWQLSKEGVGQVVMISGEPGIGKSRLADALSSELDENGYTRITIGCSPYHTNSALFPVIVHLERVLRLHNEDGADAKLAKMEEALLGFSLPLNEVIPLFASLLSLPLADDRYRPLTVTPQQQKLQTLDAIVAWLLEEAERQPVLQVWEDLHWADPSTLELLALQIEQSPTAPILNVLTCRPEFQPAWPQRSHVTPLTLNRLERPEVEVLIALQTGGDALPREVVEHIVGKTDGVPLYVEELTKVILEASFLRKRNGTYELADQLSEISIPATLQDSLMARLDRLPNIRKVAQFGAVLGREFDYEMLQSIASINDTELQEGLARLVDAELLYQRGRPPHAKYIFKHALVRDAAYASLLKAKRRQLHLRSAEVIERLYPGTAMKSPEIVAYHLSKAGKREAAIKYWLKAGEHAIARSSNAEAIAHLGEGLELISTIAETTERMETELALQSKLAVPLMFVKGWSAPDVGRAYERARHLCDHLGRTGELFPILRGYWNYQLTRGEHEHALRLAEELVSLADPESDALWRALSHRALGTSLFFVGRSKEAGDNLQIGIALDDALSEHERRAGIALHGDSAGVVCRMYAAWNLWLSGFPDRAIKIADEGITLSQDLSFTHSIGWALCFKAIVHINRRDFVASLSVSEAAIEYATEHNLAAWVAIGKMCRGRALTGLGEYAEGLGLLGTGLAKWHETGARLGDTHWFGFLAAGSIDSQSFDEARAALDNAEAVQVSTGENVYLAELDRLKGVLLIESGNTVDAEVQFQRAIDRAREQQARSLELRATTSLALLWRDKNKIAKARALLAPVYDWFSEGFDTPDLKDAKELLDQLK
jgi:class 3 adenylate cyclase/predicted ATPase